jgi:hypothetical protein
MGPGANVLIYPVADGKLMNVVAFVYVLPERFVLHSMAIGLSLLPDLSAQPQTAAESINAGVIVPHGRTGAWMSLQTLQECLRSRLGISLWREW